MSSASSDDENKRFELRDRQVLSIEEMDEAMLAALEKAEVPAEYAHLDELIARWEPQHCVERSR